MSSPTASGGTPSRRVVPPCQVCLHHASSPPEVPWSLPETASAMGSAAAPAGRRRARHPTSDSSGTTASPCFLRRVSAPG
eukprot:4419399-Pyramimonas_sp.AAC.1